MKAFLQSASGDLALVNHNLVLNEDLASVVSSAIKNEFNLWLGTWFLDTNLGVPYYTKILGQKNINAATQVIREKLLSIEGVDSIQSLNASFNSSTRQLSVTFAVTASNITQNSTATVTGNFTV